MKLQVEITQNTLKIEKEVYDLNVYPFDVGVGAIQESLGVNKGDVVVFNGTDWIRLGAGDDGQAMVADSGEAGGLGWGAAGAYSTLTNKDTVEMNANDVVIHDFDNDEAFEGTTTEGHASVVGVLGEVISVGYEGAVYTYKGTVVTVNCDTGAVAKGEFLITSTTKGRAKAGTGGGIFAVALTAKASGSVGTVKAMILNGRYKLTENTTVYVRTDGNDSNTGLANTAAGALLTIQKAIDTIALWDLGGYDVVIQVGNGTYAGNAVLKDLLACGDITLRGDTTTPANVIIDGRIAAEEITTIYRVEGFKLQKISSSEIMAIRVTDGARLEYQAIDFSTGWTHQIYVAYDGHVAAVGNYTISGGAAYHVNANLGRFLVSGATITLTGTPAFTTFINANNLSGIVATSNTWSGAATGKRYSATLNSAFLTGGATLPGNAAGTTATGGQYT
ncbi:MAG: hypothetical protein K8R40_02245 [Anaerolineaceae bacterium]|nr:hypothetical protein [Anaerolineaceae bacterium]